MAAQDADPAGRSADRRTPRPGRGAGRAGRPAGGRRRPGRGRPADGGQPRAADRRADARRPAVLRHGPLPVRAPGQGAVRGHAACQQHAAGLCPGQRAVGRSVPGQPGLRWAWSGWSNRSARPRRWACSPPSRSRRPSWPATLLEHRIDYFTAYVCENLGAPDERVTHAELAEVADHDFAPLNVMILVRKPDRPDRPRERAGLRLFGNPDEVVPAVPPQTRPADARPKSAASPWRS